MVACVTKISRFLQKSDPAITHTTHTLTEEQSNATKHSRSGFVAVIQLNSSMHTNQIREINVHSAVVASHMHCDGFGAYAFKQRDESTFNDHHWTWLRTLANDAASNNSNCKGSTHTGKRRPKYLRSHDQFERHRPAHVWITHTKHNLPWSPTIGSREQCWCPQLQSCQCRNQAIDPATKIIKYEMNEMNERNEMNTMNRRIGKQTHKQTQNKDKIIPPVQWAVDQSAIAPFRQPKSQNWWWFFSQRCWQCANHESWQRLG